MSSDSPQSLAQWLRRLESRHPHEIELGLERVGMVASRLALGNVRSTTLIIAGTNGKGSCATLAALIYQKAGYRVGLYTSPHLLAYNERIRINGQEIDDQSLCECFEKIEALRGDISLTYFEFGTLAALSLFEQHDVDIQILEVGLGGRLDAVNLVDADIALIPSIAVDHESWLGTDREQIGLEKAHVFRGGRPAICSDPFPPQSLRNHADEIGASFFAIGQQFDCARVGQQHDWNWQSAELDRGYEALPGPLDGSESQRRNAAGVLMAVELLQGRLPVKELNIRAALTEFRMPGRFQRRGRLILDVAHNPAAAEVLSSGLQKLSAGKFPFVLGMMKDKDVEAYCAHLIAVASEVYCAGLPLARGLDGKTLMARVRSAGLKASAFVDVQTALYAAMGNHDQGDIVVTGSFLTVAEGLRYG